MDLCLECCFRSPFRSMHTNSNKRSDRCRYDIQKEELGLATLKPEQEMTISNFALGKDKITGSRCFLNRCEEPDDLGSQGSFLQMKQGCSAIDRLTHATIIIKQLPHGNNFLIFFIKLNGNDITSK